MLNRLVLFSKTLSSILFYSSDKIEDNVTESLFFLRSGQEEFHLLWTGCDNKQHNLCISSYT